MEREQDSCHVIRNLVETCVNAYHANAHIIVDNAEGTADIINDSQLIPIFKDGKLLGYYNMIKEKNHGECN